MSDPDDPPRYSAPAAACAADVLLALARSPGPATLAMLIDRTVYSRSLLYRTLKTLAARGFVVEEAAHGAGGGLHYRLGSAAAEIGGAYQSGVPFAQSIRSALRDLARRTGETASLAQLEGRDVLYVMREEGAYSVLAVSQVGKRLPAHATAMGKALLARLGDEDVRARLGRAELRRFTPATVTTPTGMLEDLHRARLGGYAVEEGELVEGRCCIAMAIPTGPSRTDMLGISLSMSAARFEKEREGLVLEILATRATLLLDLRRRGALGDDADSLADLSDTLAAGSGRIGLA